MPNPINPQAYNRYSYVRNSPINFNDPTGHCETKPSQLLDGQQAVTKNCGGYTFVNTGGIGSWTEKDDEENENGNLPCRSGIGNCSEVTPISEVLDGLIWRTIPSTIGIHLGFSIQWGFFFEGTYTPGEILFAYNWRSGQRFAPSSPLGDTCAGAGTAKPSNQKNEKA